MKTTTQQHQIHVTNKNFEAVFENAIVGDMALGNYNSDYGVSSNDVRLSVAAKAYVDKLADIATETGNSPFLLLQPVLLKYGYDCSFHYNPADFEHITTIQPFDVCVDVAESVYSIGQHVHSKITNTNEFVSEMQD